MQEFTEMIKEYLKESRDFSKNTYKIASAIYRAIANNRTTFDDVMRQIHSLGGVSND